jgi:hypothetical protein
MFRCIRDSSPLVPEHSELFEIAGPPISEVCLVYDNASGDSPTEFRLVDKADVDVRTWRPVRSVGSGTRVSRG